MSKPLKVLFVQSSGMWGNRDGEALEARSEKHSTAIKTEAIKTNNNTVAAVTDYVLNGDYDAVVVEECHTFSKTGETGWKSRDFAYRQLGLTKKKEQWEDSDPNYPLSGIAIVRHLRDAFEVAGKKPPKFGYTSTCGKPDFEGKFEQLGIEDNADFYLSECDNPFVSVQNIYDACEIAQG